MGAVAYLFIFDAPDHAPGDLGAFGNGAAIYGGSKNRV
jgi:hypothetical protein